MKGKPTGAAADMPTGVARMDGVDTRLKAAGHFEHYRYGDVSAREGRDVHRVGARGPDPPVGRVVAEDDRAPHPRQSAHRLAEMVVEAVDGGAGIGLREHLDEQLERPDPEIAAAFGDNVGAHVTPPGRQAGRELRGVRVHQPEA